MKSYMEYLALLNWQNQSLSLEDFKRVYKNQEKIHSIDHLQRYISHPKTKHYLRNEKLWGKKAEQAKKECLAHGAKITWPFHIDYPHQLFKMEKPPLIISWKGENCWKNHFLFSIVGSRNPYQDTLTWMDTHLNVFLKRRKDKICIMSGGARGVDQKAHALSLATQKPTVCFLPCGIKQYYPAVLKKWEKHILDGGGAFISVFPPAACMQKSHFHTRNKVLSGLSHLILIAQAQLRSGTMVTARYALNAGTPIAVLPGSPLYAGYRGNLNLINDGCFMIRDHLDMETLFQSCKINISEDLKFYSQKAEEVCYG